MREHDKCMENETQLNKHWVMKENKNDSRGEVGGAGKHSLQDGRVHKQKQGSMVNTVQSSVDS